MQTLGQSSVALRNMGQSIRNKPRNNRNKPKSLYLLSPSIPIPAFPSHRLQSNKKKHHEKYGEECRPTLIHEKLFMILITPNVEGTIKGYEVAGVKQAGKGFCSHYTYINCGTYFSETLWLSNFSQLQKQKYLLNKGWQLRHRRSLSGRWLQPRRCQVTAAVSSPWFHTFPRGLPVGQKVFSSPRLTVLLSATAIYSTSCVCSMDFTSHPLILTWVFFLPLN